jgi:hypothetical protein
MILPHAAEPGRLERYGMLDDELHFSYECDAAGTRIEKPWNSV